MQLRIPLLALSFACASAARAQSHAEWEKQWAECPRHLAIESGKSKVVRVPRESQRIILNGSEVAAYELIAADRVRAVAYEPGYTFLRIMLEGGTLFEVCIKVTPRPGTAPLEPPPSTESPGPCTREGRTFSVASMLMKPGERTRYFFPQWQTFSVHEGSDVLRAEGADANGLLVTATALGKGAIWMCTARELRLLAVVVTPEGVPESLRQSDELDAVPGPPPSDAGSALVPQS
jgi:hypothetical protein